MCEAKGFPPCERDELMTLVKGLQRQIAQLQGQNAQLAAANERLSKQLAELQRAGKRQAAPFSKGRRDLQPKRPGRKPGQGMFSYRKPLSTVVGRLNAWIIQETQQVAPVMVPTEFVLQPPVVRIRHGTVAEMIGRLSSQPLGLGGKVRRLSSVICLPELHRFSEQAAQTIAEAATSPCSWSGPPH